MALYTFQELGSQAINKSVTADASKILMSESSAFNLEKTFDIFLSHSYLDAAVILNLKRDIEDMGFTVYVDWINDQQLNREAVTKETASVLRQRMDKSSCLLYASSTNSENSKWMPWELGYFDAKKGKVAVLPISTVQTNNFPYYFGQEYLGLYYYVDKCPPKTKASPTLWVNAAPDEYVSLKSWLKGKEPYPRD